MYHVGAQGVDERMINVHYYYYYIELELKMSPRLQAIHTTCFQHDTRALFGEVKFADSKSKTKFKKINVGFKQCVLTFYKDSKVSLYNAVTCFCQPLNLSPPV